MEDLADIAGDLVTNLRFHVSSALQATEPDAIASAADAAWTYYQGLAICELLLDAETDAFFHHMLRSARARRWLLRRAHGSLDYPKKILKISNLRGLFAALVANDFVLAGDICALSAQAWDPNIEYEDDHWYARWLHAHVLQSGPAALANCLAEYKRALDGDEPARYRLCKSVQECDATSAMAAFADLLDDRRRELDKLRETLIGTDDLFAPFSAVYVEGLAWLRLLEGVGFETDREYLFCPSLARSESYAPFKPDGLLD